MTEQIVLEVHAIGSTDAQERARALARTKGYRVSTVCRVELVRGQEGDVRRSPMAWLVTLAVRSAA